MKVEERKYIHERKECEGSQKEPKEIRKEMKIVLNTFTLEQKTNEEK